MQNLQNTALLVIDVQEAFKDPSWGQRNNLDAEEKIARLQAYFRQQQLPIIHIQHLSTNPNSLFYINSQTVAFQRKTTPLLGEVIISKKVNSAFIDTDLISCLEAEKINTLVIVGLTTPHCVSTTTRMSANLGFKTILIADCTASFPLADSQGRIYDAETVQQLSLVTLNEEFATILTLAEFLTDTSN